MPTIDFTKDLVKKSIKGFRKGTIDRPAYQHSFRVYETLIKYGFPKYVQNAGLLHDVIEDGGITSENLQNYGYQKKTIDLVLLVTHNLDSEDSFIRRENLIKKLIAAKDINAWAIKLADISDNLTEMQLIPSRYNQMGFLYRKCVVFVYYGHLFFAKTKFYQEFLDRYYEKVKRFANFLQ